MPERFNIRNTLDGSEYVLLGQLLNRTPYSVKGTPYFNILNEDLDEPFSLVFIRYGLAEDLAYTGRKRPRLVDLMGRLALAEERYSFEKEEGGQKPYLTVEQTTKGVKIALERLSKEFDVNPVYKSYRLKHNTSGYTYSIKTGEGGISRDIIDVRTLPTYRKIEPTILQADTENVIKILESLANGLIDALGDLSKTIDPMYLETSRPSDLFSISRN